PPLDLPHGQVLPAAYTKYLGVHFDQNLNWKEQHAKALAKGTAWASQIRRLSRPSWGITPAYARRLYNGVAIPRILYAVDVWCIPNPLKGGKPKLRGSATFIRHITSVQRIAALAVMGGLKSSPTDSLDICANLIP
ncbi:hypothetical protein BC826DRAFT_895238, partial [Russula brevipes]